MGASARLADELSASPQGQPLHPAMGPPRPRQVTPPAPPPVPQAPPPAERRRAERRSEQQPVLLDTRSRKGRRQASGEVGINIEV